MLVSRILFTGWMQVAVVAWLERTAHDADAVFRVVLALLDAQEEEPITLPAAMRYLDILAASANGETR